MAHHCEDISDSLKCIVETTTSHLDKHLLNRLAVVVWIHKLSCSELLGYRTRQPKLNSPVRKNWQNEVHMPKFH